MAKNTLIFEICGMKKIIVTLLAKKGPKRNISGKKNYLLRGFITGRDGWVKNQEI